MRGVQSGGVIELNYLLGHGEPQVVESQGNSSILCEGRKSGCSDQTGCNKGHQEDRLYEGKKMVQLGM